MITADILKKIREIEITTRRLLTGGLVGENQSAVKGSGFDFDQIRDYQVGDDIRFIDWKSSARMDRLLVKQYIEERTMNIILAIDISASTLFTSQGQLKSEVMYEISAILSYSTIYTKNSLGALLFSSKVELFIPLGSGMAHAHNLIMRIYMHKKENSDTSIASACNYIASLSIKNALVFVISDFIDEAFEKALRVLTKKHDVIAVRCLDRYEQVMPMVGFVTVEDPETKACYLLDLRTSGNARIKNFLADRIAKQEKLLQQSGAEILDVEVGRPFISDIVRFFRKRMVSL